ncbi:cell division protein FtsQ/DivIB [Sphingobacterium corticis]|uniref:Cell division protein FtsQ/DivIB n=1 Tax=Sphingobacterium corticis TaxID=1812823 RepID=A0ABW5NGN9_9SPHI
MLKQLKNIPWRLLGSITLVLIGVVGVVMLMGLVRKKDASQTCTALQIFVEGKETFIDQADITAIIQNQFGQVIGRQLQDIPLHKIEKALTALPYVSQAGIYVDIDGAMRVTVQQRAILLRVINRVGQEFYVDTEGKKIPTTLKYVPHTIVANGNIRESFGKPLQPVESQVVDDLATIVRHINQSELWSNQVVQLYVNDNGDIELVPRVGDQDLILGNAENLDDKLRRFEIFYQKILPRVGTEAYSKVNVKYADQIICERYGDWFIDSLQMKMNKL